MAKNQNKTQPTESSVSAFLAGFDENTQADCRTLIDLMREVSGHEPVMWGPAIIGFDQYHYVYASGREGDAPRLGFSPRVGKISIYLKEGFSADTKLLEGLGKYTTAKVCLYVKRLSDIDLTILRKILEDTYATRLRTHPPE